MKLLIAGGAGYVGSYLVPKLLERGYEVDVIDKLWFGNNLPKKVKVNDIDLFHLTEDDIAAYDQVVFMAGLSNDPMAEYSPAQNFIYNAAAPAYLGYIAKQAGVGKIVYASTCSVYGYTVDELYNETAPTVSHYPYGISKLQGEKSIMQLVDDDFSAICLRKGTISGYSPRMRLDLVVNTMFKTAITENEITVNNPAIWRPILSIQDAANAYVRAIEANNGISGIFNVASGNYTVGEIGDIVKEVVEENLGIHINMNIKHIEDYRNYKVDFSKSERVLSIKPKHDVEYIVKDLVNHLDEFKNFDNPNYYNIEVFRSLSAKNGQKSKKEMSLI